MKNIFLTTLGPSWKSSLMGCGEAVAVQALSYAINTEYHNPKIFWCGMGLSVLTIIRGRVTKDFNVSNAPVPLAISQPVNVLKVEDKTIEVSSHHSESAPKP